MTLRQIATRWSILFVGSILVGPALAAADPPDPPERRRPAGLAPT